MSIVIRSMDHDCYEHYELKNYEKLFSCDGCKMKGFGPRYICGPCGHELHKECRYPPNKIQHDYFGCANFIFREEPFTRLCKYNKKEYARCCDACGKEIRGFSYHCKENGRDLHPRCRKLQEKLLVDGTIFNLESKVSSKCKWCKKKKISDGERDIPGWSYVSSCKKYHFHVFCMMEMVQESYMEDGEMRLEKVDFKYLTKSKGKSGSGSSNIFAMAKAFIKIILSILLGDPTTFVSNVLVELAARGLQ